MSQRFPTPSQHLRDLGSRIRTLRTARGWTQRQLGRRTGIDSSRLSRTERGLVSPTLVEIRRLREALETSCDELLFGARPEAAEQDPFVQRLVQVVRLGLAAEGKGTPAAGDPR